MTSRRFEEAEKVEADAKAEEEEEEIVDCETDAVSVCVDS